MMFFFSTDGVLKNVALKDVKVNDHYNQDEKSDYLRKWRRNTDTLVWPVNVRAAGELIVIPCMGVPADQDGAEMDIIIGQQKKTIVLRSTGSTKVFADQASASFKIPSGGQYLIQMRIQQKKGSVDADIGNVKELKLTGALAKNTQPVKVLHRAKAIHSKLSSTQNPRNLSWFIGESTVTTPYISSVYQPRNTPFGYYGSV